MRLRSILGIVAVALACAFASSVFARDHGLAIYSPYHDLRALTAQPSPTPAIAAQAVRASEAVQIAAESTAVQAVINAVESITVAVGEGRPQSSANARVPYLMTKHLLATNSEPLFRYRTL